MVMTNKAWVVSFVAAGMLVNGAAQATLVDRGGGLLYDTVLNVTWLQNANLAASNAFGQDRINADGSMSWDIAQHWISAMNVANYLGYHDWRLSANSPVNGADWNYNRSFDGSTDYGWNITSPNSELAYMYYVDLGLHGGMTPSGEGRIDNGIFGNGTGGRQANVGLVDNLQSGNYWSSTVYAQNPNSVYLFDTYNGIQGYYQMNSEFYAWAVRSGDVVGTSTMPEPATLALALTGLGLAGLSRRRRSIGVS